MVLFFVSGESNGTIGRCRLEPIELARHIVHVAEEKKGEDILLLDISDQETFTDYFVFCNGTSDRQLEALRESILESVKQTFQAIPWSREGSADEEWLLLDYSDVIVHLFSPEKRAYYDLEGLWNKGKVLLRIH